MNLEHWRSGGTPLSCKRPDFPGTWHFVAAPPGGDALSHYQPRCAGRRAALPHARKAVRWRQASPHCPGEGREAVVLVPASSIATGCALRAYSSGMPPLHWPPRLATACSACLHRSRCGGGGNWSFSTRGLNRSLCDGGLGNRSLCHRNHRHRSLSDRSRHSSRTRPTGASGLGIRFYLRLPAGLAGGHLGKGPPSGADTHGGGPVELPTHGNSSSALSSW